LNLKQAITDREMDLFLEETDAFKDKAFIEREDFTDLFGQAIMKARNENTY